MRPACLPSPALGLADPNVNVRRNAEETEHARVETELLFQDACAVCEQRALDRRACEAAAARKPERGEQMRHRRLFLVLGVGKVLDEHVFRTSVGTYRAPPELTMGWSMNTATASRRPSGAPDGNAIHLIVLSHDSCEEGVQAYARSDANSARDSR